STRAVATSWPPFIPSIKPPISMAAARWSSPAPTPRQPIDLPKADERSASCRPYCSASSKSIPPRVCPRRIYPRDQLPTRETNHEQQETAGSLWPEMEPIFRAASRRGITGHSQDRELHLAGRAAHPGGRLRAGDG